MGDTLSTYVCGSQNQKEVYEVPEERVRMREMKMGWGEIQAIIQTGNGN